MEELQKELDYVSKLLEEAVEDKRELEREQERLKDKIDALEDEIESYELEASENLVLPETIEQIERDRVSVEGEFQLNIISGQARDVFMEHTATYLKMLNG